MASVPFHSLSRHGLPVEKLLSGRRSLPKCLREIREGLQEA